MVPAGHRFPVYKTSVVPEDPQEYKDFLKRPLFYLCTRKRGTLPPQPIERQNYPLFIHNCNRLQINDFYMASHSERKDLVRKLLRYSHHFTIDTFLLLKFIFNNVCLPPPGSPMYRWLAFVDKAYDPM